MSDDTQVRQDAKEDRRAVELTPEEDAARIARLKASHGSHHAAGGCAEDMPKTAANDER